MQIRFLIFLKNILSILSILMILRFLYLQYSISLKMLSPRTVYVNLIKSQRKSSIEKVRQAYIGDKKKFAVKSTRLYNQNRQLSKTDRHRSLNKPNPLNRQTSTSRSGKVLHTLSKQKSSNKNLYIWNRTCASLSKETYEDQKKKNRQGINCRLVIMNNGKAQREHFLEVVHTQDVKTFIEKSYPKIPNFVTVPRQLSLEYLFTQEGLCGKFLNGQSIYLKPEFSFDEMKKTQQSIKMQDFQIVRPIGSGGFSKVFLCRSKIDNSFYAMKLIEKEMIIKNKKKKIIMNQRNIMVGTKHSFVIDLKYAFQAEKYIVFVVEYCAGGQLFGLIKKYHRLAEDIVRFYIIEIFLGLAHLHSQKVVYRDIKPENILLGIDGHVKIADLGLAKPDMFEGQLAYSFCGSPQYMSPQMILQAGHTYPVDFYCMGALMYQLLTGLPPFYSQDPNQIYEAVLIEQLVFPQDVILTQECKSLLRSLLCKDPKKRLGSLYGTKQILAHPWFGKRNYQSYIDKKIDPPFHFKNLQKINLDEEINAKDQDSLEKVIRDQKTQKKGFTDIMKNFYYDFQEKNIPQKTHSRPNSSKKIYQINSKQNIVNPIRKMKKAQTTKLYNPIQLFNR